jgi:hypothetical protein
MTTVEILLTIIAGGWGLGLCPLDEWASRERRETALWLRQRELWGKLNDGVDATRAGRKPLRAIME